MAVNGEHDGTKEGPNGGHVTNPGSSLEIPVPRASGPKKCQFLPPSSWIESGLLDAEASGSGVVGTLPRSQVASNL